MNTNNAILKIVPQQNLSPLAKSSIEYIYSFYLNGKFIGIKVVDLVTRQQIMKQIFDISEYILYDNRNSIKEKIESVGKLIYRLMLPEQLSEYLSDPSLISLSIDTTDFDIPWEIAHDSRNFICHRIAIGREFPKNKNINSFYKKSINVCLIGNPTTNLPASQNEINALSERISITLEKLKEDYDMPTQLKILLGKNANKKNVLFETILASNTQWDIIHYAGHASFDISNPESCSLNLYDGDLKAYEVENLSSNSVVFVNACKSALTINDSKFGYNILKGLAISFTKGGALGYIGSLWPTEDKTAQQICEQFYEFILEGAGIGEALLESKKIAEKKNFHPSSVGYILYGNPISRLSIFEPILTEGPYVNEDGFKQIIKLETEYSSLEILMVNDLPWVLWRPEDFTNWISRIPGGEARRRRIENMLLDYYRKFRNLILEGKKKFIGIVNLKTLRIYLNTKETETKNELIGDFQKFSVLPNFTLLIYEGSEEEIEEIEIVSKSDDILENLGESVYVFNKQVRFEKKPPSYSIHLEHNNSLIKGYTDRFYKYYEIVTKQYSTRVNKDWEIPFLEIPNKILNEISLNILIKESSI